MKKDTAKKSDGYKTCFIADSDDEARIVHSYLVREIVGNELATDTADGCVRYFRTSEDDYHIFVRLQLMCRGIAAVIRHPELAGLEAIRETVHRTRSPASTD